MTQSIALGRGTVALIEPLLMMRPPCGSCVDIKRNACCVRMKGAVMLMVITDCSCSRLMSWIGTAGAPAPAFCVDSYTVSEIGLSELVETDIEEQVQAACRFRSVWSIRKVYEHNIPNFCRISSNSADTNAGSVCNSSYTVRFQT